MDQVQVYQEVLAHEARVNVTWAGQTGDLVSPIPFDSSDTEVRRLVSEAVRTGTVPGINADANANFTDYVVDRFAPNDVRPFQLIHLRPKTPFGSV
jgi:hypothetical protein